MRKLQFIILLFISISATAQNADKSMINLPLSQDSISTKELISEVIFNNIISGKLKMYSNESCTKLIAVKSVKKVCSDTVQIPAIDKKTGDIIGTKKIPRLYEPDGTARLRLCHPDKTSGRAENKLTFGYLIPTYTASDIIIGYKTVGYLKYDDLKGIIGPFEKKNYNTEFEKQVKEQM